ncbi:MAG: hypothetical protein WBC91_08955 [Phototrophicaceae bacterium]
MSATPTQPRRLSASVLGCIPLMVAVLKEQPFPSGYLQPYPWQTSGIPDTYPCETATLPDNYHFL